MTDAMKDAPPFGVMEQIEPGLRRILCPNPSPMTYWGTNTFVLGEGDVAIVDPGPVIEPHLDAILAGLAPSERVAKILVTHAHVDHSPGARTLSERTGAPVVAFGDAEAGRSDVMKKLVTSGLTSGGEGVDAGFSPDETLEDGETLSVGGVTVEAIWTPGHFANHLAFAVGDMVLVGDLVMAWASSLVSPPDGDLTAFLESCQKLKARGDRIHYPAHGPAITDPVARLLWLIDHREARMTEILSVLDKSPATIAQITREIYTDTPEALLPAAQRNVFASLIHLEIQGIVNASPALTADAIFARS